MISESNVPGETQSESDAELAALIVQTLNLDIPAGEIGAETPLYGEGLGLDSIDMLEIALAVSERFGVKLRAGHGFSEPEKSICACAQPRMRDHLSSGVSCQYTSSLK